MTAPLSRKLKDQDPILVRAGNAAGRKEFKKSAQTKQKILDSAARIFSEHGYMRTLMADIAKDSDVHITAIYYHFSTKEDLAEEVMNFIARTVLQELRDNIAGLPDDIAYLDKFHSAIRAQFRCVIAHRNYVLAQAKVLSELPPERQDRHREILKEFAAVWRGLLREGVETRQLRPAIDPSVARLIVQGSITWAVEWYRPDGLSVDEIAHQLAQTILCGIAVHA